MFATAGLERLFQLTQQLALVLAEFDRCLHQDVAIQVARITGAHAFDAFSAQAELFAGLRAFGYIDGGFAGQGGHVDFAA